MNIFANGQWRTERFAYRSYGGREGAEKAGTAFHAAARAALAANASLADAFATGRAAVGGRDRDRSVDELPRGMSYISTGSGWAIKVHPKDDRPGKSYSCEVHKEGAVNLAAEYLLVDEAKRARTYAEVIDTMRRLKHRPLAFRIETLIALACTIPQIGKHAGYALPEWAKLASETAGSALDDFVGATKAQEPAGLSEQEKNKWKSDLRVYFANYSVLTRLKPGNDPEKCDELIKKRCQVLRGLVNASKESLDQSYDPATQGIQLAERVAALAKPDLIPDPPPTRGTGPEYVAPMTSPVAPPGFSPRQGLTGILNCIYLQEKAGTWRVGATLTRGGKKASCKKRGVLAGKWLIVQSVLWNEAASVETGEAFAEILAHIEELPAAFRVEPLMSLASSITRLPEHEVEAAFDTWIGLAQLTVEKLAVRPGAEDAFALAINAQEPENLSADDLARWRAELPRHFFQTSVLNQSKFEEEDMPSAPRDYAALVNRRTETLRKVVDKARDDKSTDRAKKLADLAKANVISEQDGEYRQRMSRSVRRGGAAKKPRGKQSRP